MKHDEVTLLFSSWVDRLGHLTTTLASKSLCQSRTVKPEILSPEGSKVVSSHGGLVTPAFGHQAGFDVEATDFTLACLHSHARYSIKPIQEVNSCSSFRLHPN